MVAIARPRTDASEYLGATMTSYRGQLHEINHRILHDSGAEAPYFMWGRAITHAETALLKRWWLDLWY